MVRGGQPRPRVRVGEVRSDAEDVVPAQPAADPSLAAATQQHPKQVIQDRLGAIVSESSDNAAAVIKDWLVQPGDAR